MKRIGMVIALVFVTAAIYSQSAVAQTPTQLGTHVQLRDFLTSPAGIKLLARTKLSDVELNAAIAAARKGNFRRCVQEVPGWCAVLNRYRFTVLGFVRLVGEIKVNPDFSQDATFERTDTLTERALNLFVARKAHTNKAFKPSVQGTSSMSTKQMIFQLHTPACIGCRSTCVASPHFPCLLPIVLPAPPSTVPDDSLSSTSAAPDPTSEPGGPSCAAGTVCPPTIPPSGPVQPWPPCEPGDTACQR